MNALNASQTVAKHHSNHSIHSALHSIGFDLHLVYICITFALTSAFIAFTVDHTMDSTDNGLQEWLLKEDNESITDDVEDMPQM
jgi:hypothetical protein